MLICVNARPLRTRVAVQLPSLMRLSCRSGPAVNKKWQMAKEPTKKNNFKVMFLSQIRSLQVVFTCDVIIHIKFNL